MMADFIVWDPDGDVEADGKRYSAEFGNVPDAATWFAEGACHADPDCYATYEFGVDVHVRELATGKLYSVFVRVEFEPRFFTEEPEEVE